MGSCQRVRRMGSISTACLCLGFGFVTLLCYLGTTYRGVLRQRDAQILPNLSLSNAISASTTQVSVSDFTNCAGDVRLRHIEDVCERWKTVRHIRYLDPGTYWALLVDDRHRVLYCILPKAACTSFQHMIINSTGELKGSDEMAVHDPEVLRKIHVKYLNEYSLEEIFWRLEHYFKFMVVRHPFDRLYSAYTDKIQKDDTFNRKQVWLQAMRRHFPEHNPENATLSFEQFLEIIVAEYDANYKDRHWASYNEICHPCDIKYDYVTKLETLDQDLPDLLERLKSEDNSLPKLHKLHVSRNSTTNWHENYKDLWTTRPDLARRLYSLYQVDFELFGYEFNKAERDNCAIGQGTSHCC